MAVLKTQVGNAHCWVRECKFEPICVNPHLLTLWKSPEKIRSKGYKEDDEEDETKLYKPKKNILIGKGNKEQSWIEQGLGARKWYRWDLSFISSLLAKK